MFDDTPQKNTPIPENLPTEPMDMFAETEGEAPIPSGPSALDAGVLKPKQASVHTSPPPGMGGTEPAEIYAVSKPVLGKIIFAVIFILFFAGVGFGVWKLYSYLNAPDKQTPETIITQPIENEVADDQTPLTPSDYMDYDNPDLSDNSIESDLPVAIDEQEIESTSTTDIETDFIVDSVDSDGDGLLDGAEVTFKTDSFNPDTDADGLTDGDEVLIWKTNPLNPDTDGDSFKDGDEVRNGYNPLGPGKLFESQNTATSSANESLVPVSEEPAI